MENSAENQQLGSFGNHKSNSRKDQAAQEVPNDHQEPTKSRSTNLTTNRTTLTKNPSSSLPASVEQQAATAQLYPAAERYANHHHHLRDEDFSVFLSSFPANSYSNLTATHHSNANAFYNSLYQDDGQQQQQQPHAFHNPHFYYYNQDPQPHFDSREYAFHHHPYREPPPKKKKKKFPTTVFTIGGDYPSSRPTQPPPVVTMATASMNGTHPQEEGMLSPSPPPIPPHDNLNSALILPHPVRPGFSHQNRQQTLPPLPPTTLPPKNPPISTTQNDPPLEWKPLPLHETYPTSLAIPQDETNVNVLHRFIRKEYIELFCLGKEADKSTGKVGLRCKFCQIQRQRTGTIPRDEAPMAVCYPPKLDAIYKTVTSWMRCHLKKCQNIPPQLRQQEEAFRKMDKQRGRTTYWEMAAYAIGLRNIPYKMGGIYFEHPVLDPSAVQLKEEDDFLEPIFP